MNKSDHENVVDDDEFLYYVLVDMVGWKDI